MSGWFPPSAIIYLIVQLKHNEFRIVNPYPVGNKYQQSTVFMYSLYYILSFCLYSLPELLRPVPYPPTPSLSVRFFDVCILLGYFVTINILSWDSSYVLIIWIWFEYIKVFSLCCKFLWVSTNALYNVSTTTISYKVVSPR